MPNIANAPVWECGDGIVRADASAEFPFPVVAKAATYTVKVGEAGKCFSNTGASGAITFNLPAPKPGLKFTFIRTAAQNVVVDPPANVTLGAGAVGVALTGSTQSAILQVVGISTTAYAILTQSGTWA